MDVRNMRQLLAVRRHGSFAKAAKALGMSQPSLSTAIARLEDELKVKLFDRTSGGSHMTPFGELIADRAGKVIAEAEQMVRDAELVAGGEAGVIRLSLGVALRQIFMPKLIRTLAENHPGLRLDIDVVDRSRLIPLVKERELDLVICAVGDDVAATDLVITEVLTTYAIACARPDHPLVGEPSVSIERFAQFTAAGPGVREFGNARMMDALVADGGLSHYRSTEYEPLLELALGGYATVVAPAFVVEPHLKSGALARIDLDWTYKVTFAAIASRATSYSPMVSRIVRYATEIGAELQVD